LNKKKIHFDSTLFLSKGILETLKSDNVFGGGGIPLATASSACGLRCVVIAFLKGKVMVLCTFYCVICPFRYPLLGGPGVTVVARFILY
jgi:hypothetical protein